MIGQGVDARCSLKYLSHNQSAGLSAHCQGTGCQGPGQVVDATTVGAGFMQALPDKSSSKKCS